MPGFFGNLSWVRARRAALVTIALALAYHNYGGAVASWLARPDPSHDIAITRTEFRPDVPGARPAWIVGVRNNSRRFTYHDIRLEATYLDDAGKVLDTGKLVFPKRLAPGEEQLAGSVDSKDRPGATRGSLRVVDAEASK